MNIIPMCSHNIRYFLAAGGVLQNIYMRLQCGVCAILMHYNTVFVRLRCDFAFGAALS